MSTDTTTRPARPIALATDVPAVTAVPAIPAVADAADAARLAAYRARVEALRRAYRRRAHRNGFAANGVSLLLVVAGAAVGLSPFVEGAQILTAVLGVAVILLEGVTRVFRPALRAHRARWVVRRLDREFRLFDARGRGYRGLEDEVDTAFVAAVERILERADAAEEHDETGSAPEPSSGRRSA